MGLFIGLLMTLAILGQASAQTCPRDATAELDMAVAQTLTAVQNGDAGTLLSVISDDGVAFNPEGEEVGYRALQTQFSNKSGRYCALFTCNGQRGALGAKFHRGTIDKQIDSRNGRATVFINANTNDELQLHYKLRNCRWELTGVAMVE
ncbi:hypothetical protein ABI_41660 [Asticcacaulis biprosthecium C19]|uniref:DUF4440 domain-containing protein n=1 Tax=Asticcacaulis biprosthecium C19 TaxID=715226 RepID=F4QSM3_9CAUL|nr:hypothetical protein [Asticcacaulis biprosthecium]EGF89743.1 hypothetical protein ABI_41660 [Asticcacaulis biprosthecium C19]